jgi:hypothetical protein
MGGINPRKAGVAGVVLDGKRKTHRKYLTESTPSASNQDVATTV